MHSPNEISICFLAIFNQVTMMRRDNFSLVSGKWPSHFCRGCSVVAAVGIGSARQKTRRIPVRVLPPNRSSFETRITTMHMTSVGTTFRGFFAAYMSRWFIIRWSAGFVHAPSAPVPLATRSWCIRHASSSQYALWHSKSLTHIQTLIYLTSVEQSGPTNPVNKRRQPRVVSIRIFHCTPFAPADYPGYRPSLFPIFHFQPHKWPSAVTFAGITIPLCVPGAKGDSVVDLKTRTACA